ncbi:hypothetical protein C8R45DRAFT_1224227 [Mycena sanguinolenta]|nr:hypothetical protein C8R45DRAFT_1224227 [Mycena sanguinolenta]
MDRIPDEMWLEVFSTVEQSHLISLHHVSRRFHRISRPLLFKHFSFHPYGRAYEPGFLIPSEVAIKRIVRRLRFWASSDISLLVKECTVSPSTITNEERKRYTSCHDGDMLLSVFFDFLSRFTNLVKLRFLAVKFNQVFIDVVVSLRTLKEIEFGDCAAAEDFRVTGDRQLKVEKLSFLTMDGGARAWYRDDDLSTRAWLSIVDKQLLTHLSLLSGSVASAFRHSDTAAFPNVDPAAFPIVATLTVYVDWLWEDFSALHRFPAVTTVHIGIAVGGPLSPSTASFSPLLETYRGTHEFLALLDSRATLRQIQIDPCSPAELPQIFQSCVHTLRNVTALALSFYALPGTALRRIMDSFACRLG